MEFLENLLVLLGMEVQVDSVFVGVINVLIVLVILIVGFWIVGCVGVIV